MLKETTTITDRDLANMIIGCPSYDPDMRRKSARSNVISSTLLPVFNAFQVHKNENDVHYFLHNMRAIVDRTRMGHSRGYINKCIENYYSLFKGAFYNRYRVISYPLPYDTNAIPLEYNISGDVDLVIKTSYGTTLLNYVYMDGRYDFYYNMNLQATRLQIAARAIKLLTGFNTDMLCVVMFTRRSVFKRYFKWHNLPYEQYYKIYKEGLEPIMRRYSSLCNTCKVRYCSPWKTKDNRWI